MEATKQGPILIILVAALVLFGIYSPINLVDTITGKQVAGINTQTSQVVGYIIILVAAVIIAILIAPAFKRKK